MDLRVDGVGYRTPYGANNLNLAFINTRILVSTHQAANGILQGTEVTEVVRGQFSE